MKIAVFGASGDQGEAQVRRLIAAGHTPIAIARNFRGLRERFGDALDIVSADYGAPETLRTAIGDADAVFLTLPSTSFQAAEAVIAAARDVGIAARQANVGALIFNSSMIIKDRPLGFAAHDARFEMRERLFDCGVPVISIQPVIYQDNLLRAWARPAIAHGIVRYPHQPDLEVSWISQEDTADLMIAALHRPALAGRYFNVGGAEAIRGADLAARLSNVLGRSFRFESQSISEFCARMDVVFKETATINQDRLVGELGRIYHWYNHSPEHPFKVDMGPILAELPVELTQFEYWAAAQTWPEPLAAHDG